MTKRFDLEEIRAYWAEQVTKHGQSPSASWSDQMVIELEIREILKHLNDGDRVLDVGCANGYSTVQFASQKQIHIRGVDYIPEMIEQARSRLHGVRDKILGTVEFAAGDLTKLDEPTNRYDKVISIRVIINLEPNGMLLLSEATLQGWEKLNEFRREWHLPDIPMPPFNNYLDRDRVIEALNKDMRLIKVVNFASTYYVGTRVLKPLLIQALGGAIDVADPNMHWNRWFAQLPAWGEYGTQELFVFMKE